MSDKPETMNDLVAAAIAAECNEPVPALPKPPHVNVKDIFKKLQGLYKGTIYTGVYGLYTVFVGGMLLYVDWKASLLSLFVISVTHPLRSIVNSVDKVGWELTAPNVDGDVATAKRFQQRLYWGLASAVVLCDLFLVGQTWLVSNFMMAVLSLLLLAVVEVLFWQVKRLNRATEFVALADYGQS